MKSDLVVEGHVPGPQLVNRRRNGRALSLPFFFNVDRVAFRADN
jgi:hypothetical protein